MKALPKQKEGEVASGEALRLLGKQTSRLLESSPEQAFAALQCVFRNLKDTYDVLVAQSSYSKNDLRMMNLRLRSFINALMQIKTSLSRVRRCPPPLPHPAQSANVRFRNRPPVAMPSVSADPAPSYWNSCMESTVLTYYSARVQRFETAPRKLC